MSRSDLRVCHVHAYGYGYGYGYGHGHANNIIYEQHDKEEVWQ
jgi:hypothetical protein